MSYRLSELITEFASIALKDRVKYVSSLSDEDLDLCRIHFEKNWGLFGEIFSNEFNRRKGDRRDKKLNDLGL